jgi:hypothetical protein
VRSRLSRPLPFSHLHTTDLTIFVSSRAADYVIKYLWSAAGYGLISVPYLLRPTRTVGVQTEARLPVKREDSEDAVADRTEGQCLLGIPPLARAQDHS